MAEKQPLLVRILAVVMIICLVPAMVFAVKAGLSNLLYFQAEKEVIHWGGRAGNPHLEAVDNAEIAINKTLSLWRENPDYLSLAGQVRGWKGFVIATETNSADIALAHYRESLDMLRQSLKLRPAHAKTWALVAEYKTLLGEKDDEWFLAKEKALELGGADSALVDRMMRL